MEKCLDRLGKLWRTADRTKKIVLSPVVVGAIASIPALDLLVHPGMDVTEMPPGGSPFLHLCPMATL